MKLDKMVIANAFALASAIVWVICSASVFLLPDLSMIIAGWWAHGLNLSPLGSFRLDLTNFLLGGVTLTLASWGTGYILGWSWEKVSKK
jgi:hypothetical protein